MATVSVAHVMLRLVASYSFMLNYSFILVAINMLLEIIMNILVGTLF